MLFSLENYTTKFVEKDTVKKHYFVDSGLLSIFLFSGDAMLSEDVCAIYLRKRYGEEEGLCRTCQSHDGFFRVCYHKIAPYLI
ncbi:hypothetical protein C3V43_07265 [Bacteroides heparinolyticus]|uniref:Uncharacterized protein n=1 Tax=Bacteroides zoogleoformans TaxID=28119 RepID=A0ABM6T8Y2_9BACE|nr:hypothetical protein C4H11_09920 [Bacteroides zoogleoformans]AVM57578.1 hypothetical protein C3V43_07265 [Bacteroides heparinolyticus]TWJ17862.1 hypothetical protein JN06_00434 [Bacteroides zoogleoformans]